MTSTTKALYIIDEIRGWQLIAFGILMTFGFAFIYLQLSHDYTKNGLVIPATNVEHARGKFVSYGDAVYFSVTTETTLGFGDIQAEGVARVFVCIQVFLGLLLAGVVVAKITSAQGKRLRFAAHYAEGYWIEIFKKGEKYYLSFAHIFFDGEDLRYDGDNLNSEGVYEGSFKGKLISRDGTYLQFDYVNIDKKHLFEGGYSDLIFSNDDKNKLWTNYRGVCHDHARTEKTYYVGYRATDDEIKTLKEKNTAAKKLLVCEHIQNYAVSFKIS